MSDDKLRDMIRAAVAEGLREFQAQLAAARYLTPAEAAEHARVSTKTIRREVAAGRLAASRRGRIVRILSSDLDAWIQRGGVVNLAERARQIHARAARRA